MNRDDDRVIIGESTPPGYSFINIPRPDNAHGGDNHLKPRWTCLLKNLNGFVGSGAQSTHIITRGVWHMCVEWMIVYGLVVWVRIHYRELFCTKTFNIFWLYGFSWSWGVRVLMTSLPKLVMCYLLYIAYLQIVARSVPVCCHYCCDVATRFAAAVFTSLSRYRRATSHVHSARLVQ